MSRNLILNAFSPAQEVVDPKLFAGRHKQVRDISDALRTAGSCPVIYGDRGLGKTSLAVQCQLIAMGDSELLSALKYPDWVLSEGETFLTFFVTCADDVRNFSGLQQHILNSFREFTIQAAVSASSGQRILVDRQTRRKISLKFFEAEETKNYDHRARELRQQDLNLTELIRREADLLFECYGQRVLVIVDELDRVKDVSGLAAFLKALSGDALKFVLVGIAQSLSDLDLDHPSIERHLWPVKVPQMTSSELGQIVDRALLNLRASGLDYTFEASARDRLIASAQGFPWFVHVIGQSALMITLSANASVVTEKLLQKAVDELVNNRFAQLFSDLYQRAVRDSAMREIVLRTFAAWSGRDIPTA